MYEVPEELIISQVLQHMEALGIEPHSERNLIADGKLHRYCVEGDKPTTKNGAYKIHTDGCPAWYLCDHKRGIYTTGKFDASVLSEDETKQYHQRLCTYPYIENVKRKRAIEDKKRMHDQARAIVEAKDEYLKSKTVTLEHGYVKRKNITKIKDFRLGANGEMLIPLYNAESGKFQTLQRIFLHEKRYFTGASKLGACYTFIPEQSDDTLHFICEGIATGNTVFRLVNAQYKVTCAMDCGNILAVIKGLKKRYSKTTFIICADNDSQNARNSGLLHAKSAVSEGLAKGMIYPSFSANEEGSDWNDYEALHGLDITRSEFRKQLDEVLKYTIKKDNFSQSRSVDDIGDKRVKDTPTKKKLSVVTLRDMFLEGRDMFYYGSIRGGLWYMYDDKGYWYQPADSYIQTLIDEKFKYALTSEITETYIRVRMKSTIQKMPRFNSKSLFGFSNGVLELDTGKFRPHKPDDYLTFQVPYEYDAKASCPRIDKFFEEVSEKEPSRINFLLDMFSYCLIPDCRFEKIFFLIGEAGHGKSTVLRLLEALFENVNPFGNMQSITHIQPIDFKDKNQIIMLEHSLINLAYDINPDLRGNEAMIKMLTSGEELTGNLKFHDAKSFNTRAKIICACNSMVCFNDSSDGLIRRAALCSFNHDFKNAPEIGLINKLKEELPGLFNRVYKNYLDMLERTKTNPTDAIRLCCDQAELLRDFSFCSNPVQEFLELNLERFSNFVSKEDIYFDFQDFIRGKRIAALPPNAFHRAFQLALKSLKIPFSEGRKTIEGKYRRCYIFEHEYEEKRNKANSNNNNEALRQKINNGDIQDIEFQDE